MTKVVRAAPPAPPKAWKRDVAVIGVGQTPFGELWDASFRALIREAGLEAIQDAGIAGEDIDAVYVGTMATGRFIGQENVASLVMDMAGLADLHIPATRVEAAGASGGLAIRQGALAVASGLADIVVVGGVEKMTDVADDEANRIVSMALDQEWESFFGATLATQHALVAKAHMHEFGTTRKQLAAVAVKNHANGAKNPKAQFRREMTLDQVLEAPPISTPLGMFDCAPLSDGAAAIVLAPLERAWSYTSKPIRISGTGQATDTLALHSRKSITSFPATKAAATMAYRMAGVGPGDMAFAEVNDDFTISELLAVEDLGFVDKGKSGEVTEYGTTGLAGDRPINTSGGLKARGHPLGATGVAQFYEVVAQLRGTAQGRQVKNARYGLAHNVGGTGSTAVVHVLEAVS